MRASQESYSSLMDIEQVQMQMDGLLKNVSTDLTLFDDLTNSHSLIVKAFCSPRGIPSACVVTCHGALKLW